MESTQVLTPSLDTWTTFFLLAAGQGIFLSVTLFVHKKGKHQANVLLGIFILLFAITLIDYVGFWTRYNTYYPDFRGIYEHLVLLFGPLLFLYFKALEGEKLTREDALHFVPAALLTSVILLDGNLWRAFYDFQAALFITHLTVYAAVAQWYLQKKRHETESTESSALQAIRQRWNRTLLLLYGGFILGYLLYYILVRTPWFTLFYDYSISLAMTIFIYGVGYLGFRQPEIFSGEALQQIFLPAKYQNSSLTPTAARSLLKRLLKYMDEAQPYLDNELRLNTLAESMGVSTHHLSQVINEQIGKSFSNFINDYRVETAKTMLANPENKNKTVLDIAYTAGFNNKTSFNKIFKTHTGLSPAEFRNQQTGMSEFLGEA